MKNYGIYFPFQDDSMTGNFFKMTESVEKEIRSNLIHLVLTRKGSRYYLPDFGTRLFEYVFNQNDFLTFNQIEDEIRDAVNKYIPNVTMTKIKIQSPDEIDESFEVINNDEDERLFRAVSSQTFDYTAKVRIEYLVNNNSFNKSDFVIINI